MNYFSIFRTLWVVEQAMELDCLLSWTAKKQPVHDDQVSIAAALSAFFHYTMSKNYLFCRKNLIYLLKIMALVIFPLKLFRFYILDDQGLYEDKALIV